MRRERRRAEQQRPRPHGGNDGGEASWRPPKSALMVGAAMIACAQRLLFSDALPADGTSSATRARLRHIPPLARGYLGLALLRKGAMTAKVTNVARARSLHCGRSIDPHRLVA